MIKQISVLVFLVLFVWGWFFWINNLGDTSQLETQPLSQSPEKKTVVYAGEYGYNNPALTEEDEKGNIISMGPYGSILVYPETDNTISFYLEVGRGAPSYNVGALYGQAVQDNNNSVFNYHSDEFGECYVSLTFTEKNVIIETVDNKDDCGFGGNVIVDNVYPKKKSDVPQHYETLDGDKVPFERE